MGKIKSITSRLLYRLRYINPMWHLRRCKTRRLENREWKKLEDSGMDFLGTLNEHDSGRSMYQITRPQHLYFIKEWLGNTKITNDDAIIDIGCGKGGMLYSFSAYDFGKIAGLEVSETLCEICRENMTKLSIDVDVIHADASEFQDYDSFNYFYMYNPFGEIIMKSFIDNLKNSIDRKHRQIYILYANPVFSGLFLNSGFHIVEKYKTNIMFKEDAIIMTN